MKSDIIQFLNNIQVNVSNTVFTGMSTWRQQIGPMFADVNIEDSKVNDLHREVRMDLHLGMVERRDAHINLTDPEKAYLSEKFRHVMYESFYGDIDYMTRALQHYIKHGYQPEAEEMINKLAEYMSNIKDA